jgi:diguanylate cyclase (GGDEF)-like protein
MLIPMRASRHVALLVGLAAIYFVAGKLGLRLAFFNPSATPVWPPTGIALAAFLLLGARVWPAIYLGAFFVNLTTQGTVATSLGIAAGNMLEGLVGAYLVTRFAGGLSAFGRARDVFKFAVLAAGLSTAVSATLGVTSLGLAGFAPWADFGSTWLTWWLGDLGGDLVVAPALLLWISNPRISWRSAHALEALALFGSLGVAGQVVFGGMVPTVIKFYPLEFLCIPLLLWAAFRFGPREVATAILLLSAIAIWGTLRGLGPFAWETQNESLLLLQPFMGVASVMTLVLAALIQERGQVLEQLRHLSVSDPLTGLANYRRLIDVLEGEIHRSQRTERPFAILLLDLDELKKINDGYGHLVGSRALIRLADVLRASCRVVDTAARFGGDEFAVVLSEADEAAAQHVADRVRDRLAQDREQPKLSASTGIAVYPRDGETVEALMGKADQALYQMKLAHGAVRV